MSKSLETPDLAQCCSKYGHPDGSGNLYTKYAGHEWEGWKILGATPFASALVLLVQTGRKMECFGMRVVLYI